MFVSEHVCVDVCECIKCVCVIKLKPFYLGSQTIYAKRMFQLLCWGSAVTVLSKKEIKKWEKNETFVSIDYSFTAYLIIYSLL